MSLKCLIIEDEMPAQRVLKKYIGDVPALEVAGMYTSPVNALEQLQQESIDILFLDINLPKISGLSFLRSLKDPPQVIVTTAYPDHAPEGFDLNVTDYLLKPFSFERFLQAIAKIKENTQVEPVHKPTHPDPKFTFVKIDNALQKVDFEQICYIESDRDYVTVVMQHDRFSHLQTLKYWANLLPDAIFVQVHKSFIVNIRMVDKIIGNQIELGADIIPIGRHYKPDFMDKIDTIS